MPLAKHPLIVIEDGMLTRMSLNLQITQEFTFLQPITDIARKLAMTKSRCGSCAVRRRQAALFVRAKSTIASMDNARKRRLKELLNASSVRIVYRNSRNQPQVLTF